ncbi:MAG: six-cysteine ranthipeptide SCIFF [Caldisericia bacterium]|nr:six-cysteine ranthipeptide SCIFF [Caldisericia bacterium]HOJ16164.1 six-cysteine ranthipeptide SCIFF [Caldisericia bacterium]HOW02971.1 six-cysteine ranthipeptide SCIFF [Caldisericia bacterium]HXK70588.1 six-cysteine ranthipeptide SCIFF [Caldisericia bacterium]
MKRMKILVKGNLKRINQSSNCRECQTPCKSACKTSCTIGNQTCDNLKKKGKWIW